MRPPLLLGLARGLVDPVKCDGGQKLRIHSSPLSWSLRLARKRSYA
jgi:hypothetical protein